MDDNGVINQTGVQLDAQKGQRVIGGLDPLSDRTNRQKRTKQTELKVDVSLSRYMVRQGRYKKQPQRTVFTSLSLC